MNRKIKIMADSTCDLSKQMLEDFEIETIPLHIVYGSESYDDGITIQPSDIINRYNENKQLPKTAAVSTWEYIERFKKYVDDGCDIIHINIGSSISSSHQNCVAAAAELGHVYPVDSQNLSAGTGLIACKAYDLAQQTDLAPEQIVQKLNEIVPKVHMSFVIDSLEFLRAGGRCSTLAMLGANLLSLKPCIEVDSTNGSAMTVGKKYRGKFDKIILDYAKEKLTQYDNFDKKRAAVVCVGVSDDTSENVCNILKEANIFEEVYMTQASCTITSHCGAGTLGIVFLTE